MNFVIVMQYVIFTQFKNLSVCCTFFESCTPPNAQISLMQFIFELL